MKRVTLRPQPLICVRDVEAASRWYCALLDAVSGHGGKEYERVMIGEEIVLQLHDFEVDHHHGAIGDPALPIGNGVLLWFCVEDFAAAVARARAIDAQVIAEPHLNENANQMELWLRDADGYRVVIASPPLHEIKAPRAPRKPQRRTKRITRRRTL